MNPIVMAILLVVMFAIFGYTVQGRWRLMNVGPATLPFDRPGERLRRMLKFACGQWRMPRHRVAGVAHIFIYAGAVIMLLRALMLFARGFVDDPHFGYWLFTTGAGGTLLGHAYAFVKDILVILVLLGIVVFLYYRVIRQLPRMTLNFEGLLILAILTGLMVTDALYDGATMARYNDPANGWEPLGSLIAMPLRDASAGTLTALQHIGFWGHVGLILGFMNILPYTKQFHEITGFPNVYFQSLAPVGRLPKLEDIDGLLEREETLGIKRIDQFGSKAMLDFFSCTECGRCQEQCPANKTGKLLSPKELTVALRDFAYKNQSALISGNSKQNGNGDGDEEPAPHQVDLVDNVVKPEVLWACTTCSACQTECPVFLSYIDKIVDMRRYLAMEKSEFPEQLATMFQGLENAGNPYSYPNDQRAEWAEGLDVPLMSEQPDVDYLYWVGCAASFDDRSRKIARAFAQLLKTAGVSFAILGPEETCNGDPARRAGNEYLFQMLARQNVELLNGYNVKKIVTACPHCYNTLKNEYPDFGGKYEVIHHSELLAQLIRVGKLKPRQPVNVKLAYHDACYLGRHNEIYDPPREILRAIPGVQLIEPDETRDRGMCCGAGGAQMWKEEEEGETRINHARMTQLLEVLPGSSNGRTIASACPFCKTMLSDALADKGHEDVKQLDIAEVLWQSVREIDD
ncbi:MAG: 4Fe-4S dicluster domain-containing protein [Phycisphaerae bacterium]|nr:4Fe-4S dicluster domain-containing protein [Phycisphaerae bacterium]